MANDGTLQDDMQSFFFDSELAEVYLLLDFVSGRADKNLSTAFNSAGMPPESLKPVEQKTADPTTSNGAAPPLTNGSPASSGSAFNPGQAWISKICEIRWPPDGTRRELAVQATTLLLAKDHLNNAAQPANGASIAFSLLVAGDDEFRAEQHAPRRHAGRRQKEPDPSSTGEPSSEPAPARQSAPLQEVADRLPPSRTSLARQAYPGLIATAAAFRRWTIVINVFLLFWLGVTCLLSWNIATGHTLALRVESTEAERLAIYKQIADATNGIGTKRPDESAATHPATTPAAGGVDAQPSPVRPYCKPNAEPNDLANEVFKDGTQRQICYEVAVNRVKYKIARENLADWLTTWAFLKKFSHAICGGRCLTGDEAVSSSTATNDQWATALLEVLAAAVLPFCYGFLGAGAAVVRNIWAKMRDSLLTPRDLRLSFGQLALGAVVGACIGLFVTSPSSSAQAGTTLFSGPVALSASALSFIAGFGVEGIFVALERLIRRIFDIK